MANADSSADSARSTEARIARALSNTATWLLADGRQDKPPAYIRRYLCDHAAAGGCLNDEILPSRLLPFVDVNRFREAVAETAQENAGILAGRGDDQASRSASWSAVLDLARRASHVWDWDNPDQNAAALQFWAAVSNFRLPGLDVLSRWRVRWAQSPGPGEIIGRLSTAVTCADAGRSPAGHSIAVTGARDGTLSMWNLTSGSVARTPLGSAAVTAIAIVGQPAAEVAVVTGHADGALRSWSGQADALRAPRLITEHAGGPGVTAIAPAILRSRPVVLLGRQDGSLHIWDLSGNRLSPWVASHDDPVTGIATVAWPDGGIALVTVRLDGTVQAWRLPADQARPRELSRPWPGHAQAIRAVTAVRLPDERLVAVTAGDDGLLRSWDLTHGTAASEPVLAHGGAAVIAVSAWESADGAFAVSAGRDQSLRMWRLPECSPAGGPFDCPDLTAVARAASAGGSATVVTGDRDHAVRIWDLRPTAVAAGVQEASAPAEPDEAGRPAGPRALAPAALAGGPLRIWDLADGRLIGEDARPDLSGMTAAAIGAMPDGRPVAVTTLGQRLTALAVPAGGPLAVTGHDKGHLRFWDISTQAEIAPPAAGHAGAVTCLAAGGVQGSTTLVSAGTDAAVRVWDLAGLAQAAANQTPLAGQPLLRENRSPAHDEAVRCLAVTCWNSQDLLVTASNTTVRLWDLAQREAAGPALEFVTHPITALAVADVRGYLLAVVGTGLDGTLRVWDLEHDRSIWTARGHQRQVTALAVASAPGRPAVLFSAGLDHTVRAWDIEDQRPIGSPLPIPGVARALVPLAADPFGPGVLLAGPGVLAAVRLSLT